MKLTEIKDQFIRLLENLNSDVWILYEAIIEFPPFINKGYNIVSRFENGNKEPLEISLRRDWEFTTAVLKFVCEVNQVGQYNQIHFKIEKGKFDEATISILFDQKIEEVFQSNLPKSKRGKTIPWWKNPNETKDLV